MNNILDHLSETIKLRRQSKPTNSYTASLLHSGVEKCSKKFAEEATELIIAAMSEDVSGFNQEAADVIYHLLVLIESKQSNLNEILSILAKRQSQSGHAEKAARKQ